ncbi:DUF4388 domain-containing protein [bacterium]|nr:DUF4388 domain-containing protein [candidate division CSSED10-310 bacterium]
MSIKGTLDTVSLPDVMQLLASGEKTGKLELKRSHETCVIYFCEGKIVYCISINAKYALSKYLFGLGALDESQMNQILEIKEKENLQEEKIILDRFKVPGLKLSKASAVRTKEIIFDMFHWISGEFAFFEGDFIQETTPELRVDMELFSIIMEGSRRLDEWSRIRKLIPSPREVFITKKDMTLSTTDFTREEWQILSALDGKTSLEDIRIRLGMDEFTICRTMYALKLANVVQKVQNVTDTFSIVKKKQKRYGKNFKKYFAAVIVLMGGFLIFHYSYGFLQTSGLNKNQTEKNSGQPVSVSDTTLPTVKKPMTEPTIPASPSVISNKGHQYQVGINGKEKKSVQVQNGKKRININTASSDELETLPGIGKSFALRIIEYRTKHGLFRKPEEIVNVKGIGEVTYRRLRDYITVGEE